MNTPVNPDISREGLTSSKLIHFFKILFNTSTTQVLDSQKRFQDIDFTKLKSASFIGMILDIDDCVAPHHGDILPENIEILKKLVLEGWKIVVHSNMKKSPRYEEIEKLGILILTSKYAKPDVRGFEEAVTYLGLATENIVAIGDNFLTDGGAKDAKIPFIKVTPIRSDVKRSLNRRIQIAIQDVIDIIAKKRGHIQ